MTDPGELVDDAVLAAVVRGAGDAMGIIDDTGVIMFVNDFAAEMLGYEPSELVGRNIIEVTHPDDLERSIDMVATSIDQVGHPRDFSPPVLSRARHRDGSYKFVSVTGSVVAQRHDRTLLSVLLRPADDFLTLHEALRTMTESSDVAEVLTAITGMLRWQRDRPLVSIVHVDGDRLTAVGDDLPAVLTGAGPPAPAAPHPDQRPEQHPAQLGEHQADDKSPWEAAWLGDARRGSAAVLPPALADPARDAGLELFWVRPVVSGSGEVPAIVTFWWPPGRSSVAWEHNVDLMVDTVRLAMAHLQHQRQLEHAAVHDALTGLANRRAFLDAVTAVSVRPDADVRTCAVLYLDLDGFKPVNDYFGHAAGDALLQQVARRLRSTAGPDRVVARLGGDEFCVLSDHTDVAEARALGERLLAELVVPFHLGVVGELGPYQPPPEAADATASEPVVIAASIGVACGAAATCLDLVARADRALYQAKSKGGRVVHVA